MNIDTKIAELEEKALQCAISAMNNADLAEKSTENLSLIEAITKAVRYSRKARALANCAHQLSQIKKQKTLSPAIDSAYRAEASAHDAIDSAVRKDLPIETICDFWLS